MTISPENTQKAAPIQDKAETKQQQQPDPNLKQEQPATPETEENPDWRAFREARKKDRAEREAAEKKAADKQAEIEALKAAMEAAFSKSAPTPQAYQQYHGMNTENEESQADIIKREVQTAIEAQKIQYKREMEEQERSEYPRRLQQTYPDFAQTVAQENLDYLDYHYPEVSRPLQRIAEGYDKWSDIYLAVKKFVPNHGSAKKEAARAEANQLKPKSMSSTGIIQPQGVPGGHIISDDRKAANWARMQASLKGVG